MGAQLMGRCLIRRLQGEWEFCLDFARAASVLGCAGVDAKRGVGVCFLRYMLFGLCLV
jgi:hypothetical protein